MIAALNYHTASTYQSAIILVICSQQWWRNDKDFADFINCPIPPESFLQVHLKIMQNSAFSSEKTLNFARLLLVHFINSNRDGDSRADHRVVAQGIVIESQQPVITYRILSYHSEQGTFWWVCDVSPNVSYRIWAYFSLAPRTWAKCGQNRVLSFVGKVYNEPYDPTSELPRTD